MLGAQLAIWRRRHDAYTDMTIYDLGRISAVLVVLDVVAVYLYCLRRKGVYPPSHPWSGITLLLLSVGMIVGFGNLERPNPSIFSWVYLAALILSASLWTISALLRR
jgi:hypothetical protein